MLNYNNITRAEHLILYWFMHMYTVVHKKGTAFILMITLDKCGLILIVLPLLRS